MSGRPFRFGLIAAPRGPGERWLATARAAADRGFGTLLVPDNLDLHAPAAALAAAAAAVPDLRVGTHVLAAPLRTPRAAAWEGHSLTALTGGRFEFGIGTGRPDAAGEAERLGVPWGTGAQRLEQVRATIAALRERSADTPVLMAGSGPRALALAAAEADIVALAAWAKVPRAQVAAMAAGVRERAGARDPELSMNVNVVGDTAPAYMSRWLGDLTDLPDDNLLFLRGSPREMADELLRRRDGIGLTYFIVGEQFADAFAPVVALLSG